MTETTLYQVIDWDTTFENNKSRYLKQTSRLMKPNKMSFGLINVLAEPDGRTIYGIWVLILDTLARQKKPRQGYLTTDGRPDSRPLRVAELAFMFRAQEAEIRRCLSVVTSPDVGWMAVREFGAAAAPGGQDAGTTRALHGHHAGTTRAPDETDESGKVVVTNDLGGTGTMRALHGHHAGTKVPVEREREIEKEIEPPTVPQKGGQGETEPVCRVEKDLTIPELQEWIGKLFGRARAWSCEELHLLADLGQVEKKDRALLSWAYTLPRDREGWAIVNGERTSKPKENLIALLREFSSEVDKWVSVRKRNGMNGQHKPPPDPQVTPEQAAMAHKLYGENTPLPARWSQFPSSVQNEITEALRK